MPTLRVLEEAIRRSGWRRATGPDHVPNELWKASPRLAARLLYPLAYKFRLQEPIQWKGGQLIAMYKGRGSYRECASLRSIMLLSTAGKLVRSSLRHVINDAYVQSTDGLQLCGKPAQQVLFGSQTVRSFAAWQKNTNKSAGIIFCDVASAFYAALPLGHQLLTMTCTALPKDLALPPNSTGPKMKPLVPVAPKTHGKTKVKSSPQKRGIFRLQKPGFFDA